MAFLFIFVLLKDGFHDKNVKVKKGIFIIFLFMKIGIKLMSYFQILLLILNGQYLLYTCSDDKSDRVTIFISTFKEQNIPVTRSLGSAICQWAVSLILRDSIPRPLSISFIERLLISKQMSQFYIRFIKTDIFVILLFKPNNQL